MKTVQASTLGRGGGPGAALSCMFSCPLANQQWLEEGNSLNIPGYVKNDRLCLTFPDPVVLGLSRRMATIDRRVFSASFALVLCLRRDEPLFFIPSCHQGPSVILMSPLTHMLKGLRAWAPPSLSLIRAVISHLWRTVLFGYHSSSWLSPALFMSLACFTT